MLHFSIIVFQRDLEAKPKVKGSPNHVVGREPDLQPIILASSWICSSPDLLPINSLFEDVHLQSWNCFKTQKDFFWQFFTAPHRHRRSNCHRKLKMANYQSFTSWPKAFNQICWCPICKRATQSFPHHHKQKRSKPLDARKKLFGWPLINTENIADETRSFINNFIYSKHTLLVHNLP